MFSRIIPILFLLIASNAFAAGDGKSLSTFDVFLAPYFAPQYGSYKAGSVDEGKTGLLQYGARLGFKLGPVLLGGEFGGAYLLNSSSKSGVSSADKDRYGVNSSGSSIHVGVNCGVIRDSWSLIATYFPAVEYDSSTKENGPTVKAKYKGKGLGAELDFRMNNRLFLGLYASTREFNSITSGALTNADLDPKWESLTYGLTLTYLISFSDFGNLPELFKSL